MFIRFILLDLISVTKLLGLLYDIFPLSNLRLDENILNVQYRYDDPHARKLKYILNFVLTEEQRVMFINQLFLDLVASETDFCRKTYMSCSDVIELQKEGCLELSAASHRPLGMLELDEAKIDIVRSIKFLKELTGETVTSLSFPYGGPTAIPNLADSFYEGLDLKFALTMQRGAKHSPNSFTVQSKEI